MTRPKFMAKSLWGANKSNPNYVLNHGLMHVTSLNSDTLVKPTFIGENN